MNVYDKQLLATIMKYIGAFLPLLESVWQWIGFARELLDA